MKLLDWFDRKTSKWPNLMYILVGCYALGFIVSYVFPMVSLYLYFDLDLILQGQVWRIFSFILIPSDSNVFLAIFTCLIYITISKSLERFIGRGKLNFFLLSGILMQLLGGIVMQFVCGTGMFLTLYYMFSSLFVLFAVIFPDAQFLIFFLIPVKGKYMIILTALIDILDVVKCFAAGADYYGWALVIMIVASILNVLLFMMLNGQASSNVISVRAFANKKKMNNAFNGAPKAGYRHKCTICGRTDVTNPELSFRYCSKCEGNHEYCNDHLYTHMHITGLDAGIDAPQESGIENSVTHEK